MLDMITKTQFNPVPTKSSYLNFHPPEAVHRYRDPQLKEGENYSSSSLIWDKTFAIFNVLTLISADEAD